MDVKVLCSFILQLIGSHAVVRRRRSRSNSLPVGILGSRASSSVLTSASTKRLTSSVAGDTTTLPASLVLRTLITRPNSYLYNPDDEDDETLLNRGKREAAPFVCKGNLGVSRQEQEDDESVFSDDSCSRRLLPGPTELSLVSHLYVGCRYGGCVWRGHLVGPGEEELQLGEYGRVQEGSSPVGSNHRYSRR